MGTCFSFEHTLECLQPRKKSQPLKEIQTEYYIRNQTIVEFMREIRKTETNKE